MDYLKETINCELTKEEQVQPFFRITDESEVEDVDNSRFSIKDGSTFEIQKDRLYFVRTSENELMVVSGFEAIHVTTYELTGPLSTFKTKTFLSLKDISLLLDSEPQFVPQMEGATSDSDSE